MNENRFYYTFDGKVFGPFEFENINQMVNAGIISGNTLVAFEGTDNWHLLSSISQFSNLRKTAEGESLISGFAGKVSQASGLEKLEGFSLSALFSEVFAKHSPEDIEERFIVGTTDTTPIIQDVSASWPTPWAFVRLLVFSVLISLGFYYAIDRFNNPILIPGWIFVGCFGIPFAVLIFFLIN
jgi:RsiW-degrading membrane proteinase PrsW (M82 family)